ncbi:YpmA family protein [Alkalicoccus chagannorensis]|uniref:YpmA family protein n=1 Tax=Alkalicoccus chagannorensis TaxID=427072 RepID=UPI0004246D6C|nr:YpmA family protein [Alkalicoccus chagannorensis]
MDDEIKLLNRATFQKSSDAYKIVDVLNRTLKDRELMFGLALDPEDEESMILSIYDTKGTNDS